MVDVLEHDPGTEVFARLPDPDPEEVGWDSWEDDWPPGGPPDAVAPELYCAAPDRPVPPGELAEMRPGPELAARLAALPPFEVGDADLVEVVAAAERAARWAHAVQVAAVAELSRRPAFVPDRARSARDELRSAAAQVAVELRLAPSTAEQRVWTARCLAEQLPDTLAALRAGAIDYRRAAAIADVAAAHDPEVARAVEALVLGPAGRRTIGEHRAAIERALLQVAPQTAAQRHERAAAGRRVVHYPQADGMADTVATLTADGMATLRAALEAAAAGLKAADPGDGRTIDQLRADALVEMARRSLATGWLAGDDGVGGLRLATAQGRRPAIQVTVPFSTLIGIDEHPGELTGYGPIPASIARRIAADGVWRRLLTDPTTGQLLDYGTTTYQPPQDLRDKIIARDRRCVFPGCSQPAHRCQIDHTVPYPAGPTAETNNNPLHISHHDLKTRFRWKLVQPEPGHFEWTSPIGKIYTREPEPIGPITETTRDRPADGEAKSTDHDDIPPF